MLELKGVSFSYNRNEEVLKGLDLSVEEGEIFSLLGGSGSGKTTILNLVAGFLRPGGGSILINGRDVSRVPPEKREVGMVFQDHALFPHMDVRGNIIYGAKGKDKEKLLREMVELVGLEGKERRKISDLSGGERQRVALARTLAYDPGLVLLDEPLSSLDASLRISLRRELKAILKARGVTAVHVTHDQEEAMAISDRMAVMARGKILEQGNPRELYLRPEKEGTARFMGVENIMEVKGSKGFLVLPFLNVPWSGRVPRYAGIRSGRFSVSGPGVRFRAKVLEAEFRGNRVHAFVDAGGHVLEADLPVDTLPSGELDLFLRRGDIIPLA